MSQENVEIVRAAFEAWSRGEVDQALSAMDDTIEWEMAEDEPDARTLRGVAEVRTMLQGWIESFEDFSATPQEFIDDGDHVVVPIVFVARPRGGDSPVTIEETQVFTVEAGTIGRVREYRTKTQALEAVGLSEQDARAKGS
jgi:ketosteroid isomerase-like protein